MYPFKITNIGIYNSQISKPHTYISSNRQTKEFEIELPIENVGISYIDSEVSHISNDMLICAKPNQMRHTQFPFKCYYVHMQVLDEYLTDKITSFPTFIKIDNIDTYKEIFEELQKYGYALDNQNEIMVQSLLLKLVYKLCSEPFHISKTQNRYRDATISTAIKFIEENINDDLSLENVAKYVSLSPIYFHNRFKRMLGTTLHSYVENERIKKSINLMLHTDMSLTEIAYECGFSSQSYYSYVFKRKMNTTPRQYVMTLNSSYKI